MLLRAGIQRTQTRIEVVEQCGLMEQISTVLRVIFHHHLAESLCAPQPATERNKRCEIAAAEFRHRVFDFVERAIEFLAHELPVASVGRIDDRIRTLRYRFANAERTAETQHTVADVFHLRHITSLDRDEALRDDTAQIKRLLRRLAERLRYTLERAQNSGPVRLSEFVQHAKNLTRHRNDHIIHHPALLRQPAHINLCRRLREDSYG